MNPSPSDAFPDPVTRTSSSAEPDPRTRPRDWAFKAGAVIVLAVLYLLFIDRFSTDLNGQRYFALSDDQMISMRYADNLASGNGLVWNPGERVEGFTNPLWTGYMAVWHLVDIPRAKTSLAIMLTSALMGGPVGMHFHGTAMAYLEHNARFLAPVRPGDTLALDWTITGLVSKPAHGAGVVELEGTATNQAGIVAARASGKIMVFVKPV